MARIKDFAKDINMDVKEVLELIEKAGLGTRQSSGSIEDSEKSTVLHVLTTEKSITDINKYLDGELTIPSNKKKAAPKKTEEKAAELQHEIETEDMSQLDYNFKTQDLYELWDSQLNQLWSYLQENLSADEMDRLTAEERNWIESKEKAVKEAGAPYEGGSIQPMIMNQKAAELTRERVLELQKKYL